MQVQTALFNRPVPAHLPYLLYLPKDYDGDVAKTYPLLLFLHGAGERGEDVERLKVTGLPQYLETQADFPFIVLAPQCPERDWWPAYTPQVMALLDEVITNYAVDPARVYLTGLSMGGLGTWFIATQHPQRFAAIAPICGAEGVWAFEMLESRLGRIAHLPIWTFHGALDTVVPITVTVQIVEALRALGSEVHFTVYPDAGHDSWTAAYHDPALYTWLLKHRIQLE